MTSDNMLGDYKTGATIMKTYNFIKSLPSFAAVLAMLAGSVFAPSLALAAATDGTLGDGTTGSTGTVDISVHKPAQARISGMSDTNMTLASWVIGDGTKLLYTTACVYSTSGAYTLAVTGDGTGGAFTITDGLGSSSLHTIPYTVAWDDAGVGSLSTGGTAMSTTASQPFTHANVDSDNCAGGVNPGMNGRLNVTLANADLLGLASGDFAGTLTLLVKPN